MPSGGLLRWEKRHRALLKGGYEGALCAVCSVGYFTTPEHECLPCDVGSESAAFFLVGFFVMLLLVALVPVVVIYSGCLDSLRDKETGELKVPQRMQARFKILVTFSQIMGGYPPVLNVALPYAWQRFSESVLSFTSLGFLSSVPGSGCLGASFYDRLIVHTSAPLALVFLLLAVY